MKKCIFLLIWFFPAILMAQSDPIDKIFRKYGEEEGYTAVYITGKMFEMISHFDTEDPDLNELVNNITRIRILTRDVPDNSGVNFYEELKGEFDLKQFEELMTVHESDQDVKFLIKEKDGKVSHLLLIVGGESNTILSIEGQIDLKNISRLTSEMGLDELGNF